MAKHIKQKVFILISLFLCCLITACFSIDSAPEDSEEITNPQNTSFISSLRLYLAKGSFSSTEFEQFSVSGTSLFYECGKIRRGRNIPESQGIIKLEDQNSADIILLGMEILGRASTSDPLSLAEPGDLQGFADTGKVVLNLTTKDNKAAQITNGLTEVSDPLTALERSLLKLSVLLRAEVKNAKGPDGLCENEIFFGIS